MKIEYNDVVSTYRLHWALNGFDCIAKIQRTKIQSFLHFCCPITTALWVGTSFDDIINQTHIYTRRYADQTDMRRFMLGVLTDMAQTESISVFSTSPLFLSLSFRIRCPIHLPKSVTLLGKHCVRMVSSPMICVLHVKIAVSR